MIVILKHGTTLRQAQPLIDRIHSMGLDTQIISGENTTVLGIIGDTTKLDPALLAGMDIVESVRRIIPPYQQASRASHPDDSIIQAGNIKIGGGHFAMIAGPCSVESETQIMEIARSVKASGANILRGGAFKPRTSPYAFQGLKKEGIELLLKAKADTGMPIITEITDIRTLELFADVDIIQVGARNMQNYDLLRELGGADKPILLKRGLSSTITDLLMSAEYVMSQGNSRIILCERGIRTYETATRNTLDLSAVPVLHDLTHLPVIVDPSHATGKASLVPNMAAAAAACGADGIMMEVHNDPARAMSDGAQSLTPAQYQQAAATVRRIREAIF